MSGFEDEWIAQAKKDLETITQGGWFCDQRLVASEEEYKDVLDVLLPYNPKTSVVEFLRTNDSESSLAENRARPAIAVIGMHSYDKDDVVFMEDAPDWIRMLIDEVEKLRKEMVWSQEWINANPDRKRAYELDTISENWERDDTGEK